MNTRTINAVHKEPITAQLGSYTPPKSTMQTRYKELLQLVKPNSVALVYPFAPLTDDERADAKKELHLLQGDEL